MEKEHDAIIGENEPKTAKEFWQELMKLVDEDDASGVEHLLMNRGDLMDTKLPGEDEIFTWLQGRAENKLGRNLLVELNEKGIIVPIESGRDK